MSKITYIRGLALASGLLLCGAADATTICDLDLTNFNFNNTGVCGQVDTELAGALVGDLDESTSVASASAQQGAAPPAAGGDGASGTATATYPQSDGTGGSVGAASYVSGGSGAAGTIASTSGAFYIGEFVADDGLPGSSNPFDLTVNLGIDGELFAQGDATTGLAVAFAAVDAAGATIGSFFGVASLVNAGPFSFFSPLLFTDPLAFSQSASCSDFLAVPHECTVTASTTESVILAGLTDGDVFGLFLSVSTVAALQDGAADAFAYADFANTVDLSFAGGNVTALPARIAVPEPTGGSLVMAALLALGLTRMGSQRARRA